MPDGGLSALIIQKVDDKGDYDLYDILADLGYGMSPRTRKERADAFNYKNGDWLSTLPVPTSATLKAMASQFIQSGTDSLENPYIFQTPDVVSAGGIAALKILGNPPDVLRETKERIFSA